jgi:flagellar biogenesis protein FliO
MTTEQYLEQLRANGVTDEKITDLRKKFVDFDLESAKRKKEYDANQEHERKEKDALFFVWIGIGFLCLITALFPIVGCIMFVITFIGIVIYLVKHYIRFKQAKSEG